MDLFKTNFNIDFVVKRMGKLLTISTSLVVLSILAIATMGLNFGTDFAGGYEIQLKFPKAVSESEIRTLLEPMQLGESRVQRFGDEADNEYLVLVREHGAISNADREAM